MLPLDDRTIELFGARFRDRSPHPADRHYTYRPPMSPMPAQVGAPIGGRSWDLDATHRPARRRGRRALRDRHRELGRERVRPGRPAGVRLQLLRRPPRRRVRPSPCRSAASVVGVRFRRTGKRRRRDPRDRRRAECGAVELPFVMHIISSVGPSVGYDHGSPVSDRLRRRVPVRGTLERIDIQLRSSRKVEAGEEATIAARVTMARQ